MSRCQFDALCRNKIDQRVGLMTVRQHFSHRPQHFLIGGRSADAQHLGVPGANGFSVFAATHAASDQHPTILADRFANRLQALLLGGIDKPAGVDDDYPRVFVVRGDFVSLYPKLGQDAFGVDQRFGTTQRNEADFFAALGGCTACIGMRHRFTP